MGGCWWDYFVPYESDVEHALQSLREEVFRTGRYQHMTYEFSAAAIASEPELADEESVTPPGSIEELLEQEAESGTNSILDITHISAKPEFASLCPMPVEQIRQIFGTEKPTRAMVEAKRSASYDLMDENSLINEGWMGAYFTVYKDESPHELYFVGSSGDH